ncbi:helix-turn-helix domain-containing protein [Spirosoma sp. HMF4905]|uniref:Helix-turn-helix domain-containing protein n=1 Tax=Spirosoma arboris TaxID=2682092 RepID=A0A7K1S587_9BACT|nr:helix-turn-helix transcriptional regulator [Spirosoma arboris]MVM28993.1 helix-turn-helix domain-containing protein [Spirosoma arboris]
MNKPDLDQWTTAFALMAFLGLFMAPLLLKQAGQQKHQIRYIVAILVLFSIVLIYYVLYWSNYLQFFPYLNRLAELLFLSFGVLFYCYLKELLHQPVSSRTRLIHFLPFLVVSGIHLLLILLNSILPDSFFQSTPFSYYRYFYKSLPWIVLIHLSLYAVAIIRLQPSFQSLREVSQWARWFSLSYLGFVLANWSYHVLVNMSFFNRDWDYAISLSMAIFIGLVAVLAYLQPHIFQTNQLPISELRVLTTPTATFPGVRLATVIPRSSVPTQPEVRYRHSGLPAHIARQFAQQLQELMCTEKLYHDNELRLETVAERLNISRHHLSQVLNEQLGMNFFEYINSLRIKEARELLQQVPRQQLNIIEVAYQVGFNNKVSFNKAFKHSTGQTPSEFRRSMQDKPDYNCSTPADES